MDPALADLGLVQRQAQQLLPLDVVPLRLAGDDGANQPAAVVIDVLVDLDRLPAQEPALTDP
jgi:hypothetical protein